MNTSQTTLLIDNVPFGWQSGLRIRETLSPISAGETRRTVNATLVNLMAAEFRKYALSLSSDDIRPPALAQVWRGTTHEVVPISELGDYIAAGGSSRTLLRDPHPGSVRCLDTNFTDVSHSVSGRVITLSEPAGSAVRIFYRPILSMMALSWSADEDESAASTSWSLELEEV